MHNPDPIESNIPPQQLPGKGGLLWTAEGGETTNLPVPCIRCLQFLAKLTDEDLARFLQRVREQTGLEPTEDPSQGSDPRSSIDRDHQGRWQFLDGQ